MKNIPILFENDEILVINKPSGVPVQGGQGILHPLDKELAVQAGYPVFLVHRLDRDTNGLMLVAKSAAAASKWTRLIGGKLVRKEYTALCVGKLSAKKGAIRTAVVQHGDEKPAVTHFQVVDEKEIFYEDQKIVLSTVKLQLETGRMHQIRIHLAKQGCPIAGDDKHGNFKMNKILRKAAGIKTLQLTSSRLSVPLEGRECIFEI